MGKGGRATWPEAIMSALVAHCPGIQCKMVGACCYSACQAVPALVAENERLRASLSPLVADAPCCYFNRDGEWSCAYCNKVGYHAPDCPWARAREALGD